MNDMSGSAGYARPSESLERDGARPSESLDRDRARLLEALRSGRTRRAHQGIGRADRSGPIPVSFTQRRLYFLDQLVPGTPAYLIFETVRLGQSLDVAALHDSLQILVRRHEALRTVFAMGDQEPVQIVVPADEVGDILTVQAGADAGDALSRWVRRPFDLASDPMLRALLVQADEGWVLGLCVHHIAADAWSVALLLRELADCYGALAQGQAPGHDPCHDTAALDYPDFALWQRERLTDDALASQLAYWQGELTGAPEVLRLPLDHARPAVQSFVGGRVIARIPAELAQSLAQAGRAGDATTFMTLFAIFAILLERYSGQPDLVVGVPTAGRPRVEFENIVGFFANTLVVRADLHGDPSFAELLGRVRARALGAFAHQDLPFEALVDQMAPGRDMSRNPLFQVKFALQNAPAEPLRLPGVDVWPYDVDNDTSKFDLSLDVTPDDNGFEAVFEYDSALFDATTIGAIARHYLALCRAVAADQHVPISALPMLDEAERRHIRRLGTGPRTDHGERCVHQLIADQAARTPDAAAVIFGTTTLTYRELDERVHRLARYLGDHGAGPETLVAVHMNRSTELVIALLGVLRAGAAYLPVDPGYPAERVRYLLADARCPLVITQPGLAVPQSGDRGRRVIELGPDTRLDAPGPAAGEDTDPDQLAYVIYTSGSTGGPKGAMISHRALVNRLEWMRVGYTVTAADRIVQKTPYSFDVSAWEFFLPLISGAALVLAEPGAHSDPLRLASLFSTSGVTIAHFVPPMLDAFLAHPGKPAMPDLRLVICSGQGLPASLPGLVRRELGVRCDNLYGPTEAAIDVSAYTPGQSAYEAACAVIPIGRPIDNIQLYVLGPDLDLRPAGAPGELHIGGIGVGRGYLGRRSLTAERFVPDPFGPPGAVLYRTGDLARVLPDGNIEYLGRVDSQLKIRGFRVEPGEIEAVLRRQPGVRDAAVLVPEGGESLVGFVVPAAAGGEPHSYSAAVVRDWAAVWDDVYLPEPASGAAAGIPADQSYPGWRCSRGGDYSAADMAEWIDDTVAALTVLGARQVLEIGCGMGLLFARFRDSVQRYVGTDLSAVAIGRMSSEHGTSSSREFRCEPADAVSDEGAFDLVILNSVVQYFPDLGYLSQVLDKALRACQPGGSVFIGDVRSLRLRDACYLWALGGRAQPDHRQLAGWIAAERSRDSELVIDPAFFLDFAAARGVIADLRLKHGSRATEMNLFRYDVYLRSSEVESVRLDTIAVAGWAGVGPDGLAAALADGACRVPIAVTDIPHPGLVPLLNDLDRADAPDADAPAGVPPGMTPAEVAGLAAAHGLHAHCVPALARPGHFHAVLAAEAGLCIAHSPAAGVGTEAGRMLATSPVLRQRDRCLIAALGEQLQRELPEYMVPARLVILEDLPLTPNGKVDHRALSRLTPSAPAPEFHAPLPGAESELATILAELLGAGRIGRHDNFFSLGGESILALLLVNRALQAGLALAPILVFQHPTIAGMAAAIARFAQVAGPAQGTGADAAGYAVTAGSADGSRATMPELGAGGTAQLWHLMDRRPWQPGESVKDAYPLSPMQHEMLSAALDRHEPGLHVCTSVLRITGTDFDEGAFTASWQYLMQRHAVYRTSFTWRGLPVPVQSAWRVSEPPISRVDLGGLGQAEQNRRITKALLRERRLVLDPAALPQWHITLFRLGTDDYRAMLTLNYMFQDGWSFDNLQREFFAAYDAFRSGQVPRLAPIPPFSDYIDWLAGRSQADVAADARYWTRAMTAHRGRTPILERLGRARNVDPGEFPYQTESIAIDPEREAMLRRAVRDQGITMFTLFQGAWAILLSSVCGHDTVTFGVISSGRPEQLSRVAEMIGPFNNMLPVVSTLDGRDSAADWLAAGQRAQVELRQHQYVSLAQIREWAGLPWRESLYDSYIVYENFPMDAVTGERMAAWVPESGVTQTEHPLRVLIWPAGELSIEISYYRRYFDAATIRALLCGYEHLILALASRPAALLDELRQAARAVMPGGVPALRPAD